MPINGLTRAAMALRLYERRQEVVSNNLANVDTNGFKAERVFAQALADALPVPGARTDRSGGALVQTDAPLDVALGGAGFMVVQTPEGEMLTRAGSFRIDPDGQVVDPNGNPLLGEQGPITLGRGRVEIDERGTIREDGREIARLRLESVPVGENLAHAGGGLFFPSPARAELPEGERVVRQGFLEGSNVNAIDSMVEMISVQRAYTAVQRTITTLDEVRGTIATDIGKPV